jgi:hypothetical protein
MARYLYNSVTCLGFHSWLWLLNVNKVKKKQEQIQGIAKAFTVLGLFFIHI